LALSVPLSRFTSRVGGGSAFYVRRQHAADFLYRFCQFGVYEERDIMKQKHRLILVAVGSVLIACVVASFLLPPIQTHKVRRHAQHLRVENSPPSVISFTVGTNAVVIRQSLTP
jgi:hypothetical protein